MAPRKIVCDICWIKGSKKNLQALVVCRTCEIHVHPECYGLGVEYTKRAYESFQCWACQAVGKTLLLRSVDGSRQERRIKERPTECCLCGTNDDGHVHAMHPLFDDHGKRARQLLTPGNNNPAWAHTLCAYALNRPPVACVFGCHRDGSYEGAQQNDDGRILWDEDTPINPLLDVADIDGTVTHFAYTMDKWYGSRNPYIKTRREFQKLLKCSHCGMADKGSFRVAIQCMANEACEFDEIKQKKKNCRRNIDKAPCTCAFHVGCARYRKNDAGEYPHYRTVWFYPGVADSAYPNVIYNMFCTLHAHQLTIAKVDAADKVHYPEDAPVAAAALPGPYRGSNSILSRAEHLYQHEQATNRATQKGILHDRRVARKRARKMQKRGMKRKLTGDVGQRVDEGEYELVFSDDDELLPAPADKEESTATRQCPGVWIESLVGNEDQESGVVEVFGRLTEEGMTNLARALETGESWPFGASCHGALFRNDEKVPWCKVRALGNTAAADTRHHFSLHGGTCTGSTPLESRRCEECQDLLARLLHIVRARQRRSTSPVVFECD